MSIRRIALEVMRTCLLIAIGIALGMAMAWATDLPGPWQAFSPAIMVCIVYAAWRCCNLIADAFTDDD